MVQQPSDDPEGGYVFLYPPGYLNGESGAADKAHEVRRRTARRARAAVRGRSEADPGAGSGRQGLGAPRHPSAP